MKRILIPALILSLLFVLLSPPTIEEHWDPTPPAGHAAPWCYWVQSTFTPVWYDWTLSSTADDSYITRRADWSRLAFILASLAVVGIALYCPPQTGWKAAAPRALHLNN